MNDISSVLNGLELAQVGWVVPDIYAAIKFLSGPLDIGFSEPGHFRAQDLNMNYQGQVVPAEWLTTQVYNGIFIELIQPLSGQSMFRDYLERFPAGGVQHLAYRLPVAGFEQVTQKLKDHGFALISEVDHPIARMAFFDTYQALGVATEIMGITEQGWSAIRRMENK